MGFGSFLSADSETNAYDQRAAAADQALLSYGRDSQAGSVNVGRGAAVQTGGLDLSKTKIEKGGTLSVTLGDTQPLQDLSETFALTVRDISTASTTGLQSALEASGQQIQDAISKLAKLGESTTTGGDSERNKIILWVVLGVLGLVGAIFYFRR